MEMRRRRGLAGRGLRASVPSLLFASVLLFAGGLRAQTPSFDDGLNLRDEASTAEPAPDLSSASTDFPAWPAAFDGRGLLDRAGFEGLEAEGLVRCAGLPPAFKLQVLRDLRREALAAGGEFWGEVARVLDEELGETWRGSSGLDVETARMEAVFGRLLAWVGTGPLARREGVSLSPPPTSVADADRKAFDEMRRDGELVLRRLEWSLDEEPSRFDACRDELAELLSRLDASGLLDGEALRSLRDELRALETDLVRHRRLEASLPPWWRFWERSGFDEARAASRRDLGRRVSDLAETFRALTPVSRTPARAEVPSSSSPSIEAIRFHANRPPDSGGMAEALIRLLETARPGTRLSAQFYQVDLLPVCRAFAACAERLGPEAVTFVTDDHYLQDDDGAYAAAYGLLREAGIVVRDDTWSGGSGSGQCHNKAVVVDGEFVWTGSFNITGRGARENPNDALLIRSRNLAEAYEAEILQMGREGLFGKNKAVLGRRIFVVDGRGVELYFSPRDETNRGILREIARAEHRCWVAMFSLTDLRIVRALVARARQGVDVRVYLDNLSSTLAMAYDPASSEKIPVARHLADGGVRVQIESTGAMMHHKFAVIDWGSTADPRVLTGSHNWSDGADTKNDENLLVLHDPELADRYGKLFLERCGQEEGVLPPRVAPGLWEETLLLDKVCFSGGRHEDFVALRRSEDDRGGEVDVGGVSLVADASPLFVLPEGTRLAAGETILVVQGETAPPFPARHVFTGVRLSLTNTDENLNLVGPSGFVRDAVVWANGDGRFMRGEEEDLAELCAEGQWRRDRNVPLDERLAVPGDRVARDEYLSRREGRDGNTARDWEVRRLPAP